MNDIMCQKMESARISYRLQTARRVKRSVKVTKQDTIRYVMHGFLLMCYSNFVPKTCRFSDIRLQTCRDLDMRVRGHSRSLKMVHSINYVWFPITVLSQLCPF